MQYFDMKMSRGEYAKQTIWGYHDFGVPAEDVLKSAAANAAVALQMTGQIGVIKENAFADITVFNGDMKKDFKKSLYDVQMVMKDGRVEFQKCLFKIFILTFPAFIYKLNIGQKFDQDQPHPVGFEAK